jgi:hypothetical protein
LTVLAGLALFWACDSKSEEALPDSGEALTLSAQMDAPLTRSTVNNTWDGTETVRVNLNGTTRNFTVASDYTLTPSPAIYWQDVNNTVSASAWYPASGYTFPAIQSGGLQAADFLFAEKVTDITQSNWNSDKKLTFHHKTAKVVVRLVAGDGIASVSGATVRFYGYTAVAAIDTTSASATGAISGMTDGWLTPATGNGRDSLLMLPRAYSATGDFLKVTLGGKDYYWKPALDLEAGKAYTFEVTVTNAGVSVKGTISDWGNGNTYSETLFQLVPPININIGDLSATTSAPGWRFANNTLFITDPFHYTITGTTNANRVVVASGVTADITLSGVSINMNGTDNSAFDMTGATVNLTLIGTNDLKGGGLNAALLAPGGSPNSVLVIGGSGTLNASGTGGSNGRTGIGGGGDQPCGDITINSGEINAEGYDGAGIGSGRGSGPINNLAGRITINGGTVNATTTEWGAAIGGGRGSDGGTIIINGGDVRAEATGRGNGIGSSYGVGNPNGGTIIINGGTVVSIAAYSASFGKFGSGADPVISLPATYRWWANTTNSDPGGAGTTFPGTAFNNSDTYKYVKIVVQ